VYDGFHGRRSAGPEAMEGDTQMTQQITITLTDEQTRAIIREFSSKADLAMRQGFFESAQLYSEIVKAMTQAQSEVAA